MSLNLFRSVPVMTAIAAVLASCGDEHGHENPNVEACEHLKEGPSVAVAATTTAGATAPAIASDHKRYDLTLPVTASPGSFLGHVTFAAPAAGDFIVFTSAAIPVKVTTAAGADVAPESTASSITECTEVKGRHVFELGVGTHYVALGPATNNSVSVVVEPGHEH